MGRLEWSVNELNGVVYQTLVFPNKFWPKVVRGGDESLVYREAWKVRTQPIRLFGIWTFIGLDRGDIAEADTDVFCQKGIGLVHRSLHKENFSTYDAWKYYPQGLDIIVTRINFYAVCRVNGLNTHLDNRLSARVHFGLRLVGEDAR